jgi:hypothetical protein
MYTHRYHLHLVQQMNHFKLTRHLSEQVCMDACTNVHCEIHFSNQKFGVLFCHCWHFLVFVMRGSASCAERIQIHIFWVDLVNIHTPVICDMPVFGKNIMHLILWLEGI